MGGSHSHPIDDDAPEAPVRRAARLALIVALAVAFAGTVLGLVGMWPHGQPKTATGAAQFAAKGVTFPHATILQAQPACKQRGPDTAGGGGRGGGQSGTGVDGAQACGQLRVKVGSGPGAGTTVMVPVSPDVSNAGLGRGDSVELIRTPPGEGRPATFSFFSIDRSTPLWILAAVFVVLVAAVARLRGILALVGLGFGAVVVVKFMLPGLLAGGSGLGIALIGSSAIMFVVLYLAHGVSMRTSTALAGTLVGILISALVGVIAVQGAHLSGISDESGAILSSFVGDVSFQGLLTCAIIIAGLGVLNDVTITQASAVWELRAAAPGLSRRELFTSGMRIGRDHIASTIYTIVFAYAGTALTVLLLLYLYDRPLVELLSTEDMAEEVVRTLASSIGLVLAVPATTAIAVAMVAERRHRGRRSII
jgi:uncharacterized membrane protein